MTTATASSLQIPPGIQAHKHWDDWMKFHLANRQVIRMIIAELDRAKDKGLKKCSIKTIIGCIRWNLTVDTVSNDEFKVNDKFTSLYGYVIAYNFPEYREMINRRELRARKNDGRRVVRD